MTNKFIDWLRNLFRLTIRERELNQQEIFLQNHSPHSEKLFWESKLMLKYIVKKGFQNAEWIDNKIIRIDWIVRESLKLRSEMENPRLTEQPEEKKKIELLLEKQTKTLEQELTMLPRIHRILLEQVSPVTPQSIWITEPNDYGELNIPIVVSLRLWALFCFFPFILFTLISTVVLFVVYGLVVYNKHIVPDPDIINDPQFWGKTFIVFVPVAIVVMIVIHIIFAIVNKIITNEDIPDKSDEMDKLIDLKAIRVAQWFFGLGFMLAMGSLALGMELWVMFVVLIASCLIGSLAEGITQIYLYKKGV